jgi:hypothetical protein
MIIYPEGGGLLCMFLNWALGLQALGCRVIWLELLPQRASSTKLRANLLALKRNLEKYGLADSIALFSETGAGLPEELKDLCLDLDAASEADLLLDLQYALPEKVVARFPRSALVDLDPGLLQIWMSDGHFATARHDVYFTTGETVGRPGSGIPDCGIAWHYTPPPVSLEHWLPVTASADARYTTVAHWYYGEMQWKGETFNNDKRASFIDYLSLPGLVDAGLELALCLGDTDDSERLLWEKNGWKIRPSWDVALTPADYQNYIANSRGEFSCAKPAYIRLQTAWVSERTLCYLASGKPAIVQHTGPSAILPDGAGVFRFRNLNEAAAAIDKAESDYENQCCMARALAEEHFDAKKVVAGVLEKALN